MIKEIHFENEKIKQEKEENKKNIIIEDKEIY